MRILKAVLLAILTYVAVGTVLISLVHIMSPGDFDEQGNLLGGAACMFGLMVQALSCFLAGAVAMTCTRSVPPATMIVAGSVLFVLNLVLCAAFWTVAPAWYNWTTLAMTFPFAALGVAWKGETPLRSQRVEAR